MIFFWSQFKKIMYGGGVGTFVFDIINNAELDKLYSYILDFPEGVAQARTAFGDRPLHYAVRDANPTAIRLEIIKILLSHGGDMLAKDDAGMTPIHIAANAPFAIESLELLLAHAVGKFCKGNNSKLHNQEVLLSVGRLRAIPNMPVELDHLYDRLQAMVRELPDISRQLLEALKYKVMLIFFHKPEIYYTC